jgi:hypothetical protein
VYVQYVYLLLGKRSFFVSRSNKQTSTVASFCLRFFPIVILRLPSAQFSCFSSTHFLASFILLYSFLIPLLPSTIVTPSLIPLSFLISFHPYSLHYPILSPFPHFSHSLFISISYFFLISSPYYLPQARIYKEYYSVCPLVGIWTLPTPLSPASVPLPPEPGGGGGHTRLRVSGWGSPNSDDWRKGLALCVTFYWPSPVLYTRATVRGKRVKRSYPPEGACTHSISRS